MLKEVRNFFKRRLNKKGMEMEEIVKILFAVLILVILGLGIWLLISGKGGSALDAIKKMLRLGR